MIKKSNTVSAGQALYDAEADMLFTECEMAKILYSIGLDGGAIDNYEIEEVIDAIHRCFYYKQPTVRTNITAYDLFVQKHADALKLSYRRLFAARKMIKGAIDNV